MLLWVNHHNRHTSFRINGIFRNLRKNEHYEESYRIIFVFTDNQ